MKKGLAICSILISLLLALTSIHLSSVSALGTVERVSVSSSGVEGNSMSITSSISADGRFVAFMSWASNLVPNDTNMAHDIFVYDRQTGTTERVSVSSSGAEGKPGHSLPSSISADGRFVAFASSASNLVPGDTNNIYDIFVRDRQNGTTEIVSLSSAGVQGNNWSENPSISADGRYVAFFSWSNNLVPGDTNGRNDIFVRDRLMGTTEWVSISSSGTEGNSNNDFPSISADGRFVAFQSFASNLVSGDTNGRSDVFVRDRQMGTTERISLSNSGVEANGDSLGAAISADGRYVAFASGASNLVPGDTNGTWDIFIRDRLMGTTERVSLSSSGAEGNGASYSPTSISADGRFVVFNSLASNLVPGDTNGTSDIFIRDRLMGTTERISLSNSGSEANGGNERPSISANGKFVTFTSFASNLVSGDTNNMPDIFVVSLASADTIPPSTSLNLSGTQGNNGWYVSNVQMTLTAIDNAGGSGVKKTEYSFDGVNWNTYNAPFTISNEGTITIYYKSTDNAGNVETVKTQALKIDKTNPAITINSPQAGEYLTSQSLSLNFAVSDNLSGIDNQSATLDGNPVASGQVINLAGMAGNHILTVSATDKAGNGESKSVIFTVAIAATIDIDPDTLNLKSQSDKNAITVYIEFPAGYDVGQINVATVKMKVINTLIPAQPNPTTVGDYDGDAIADRMVKFDRALVIAALGQQTGNVTLTVSGGLINGSQFTGSDTINVINPGK